MGDRTNVTVIVAEKDLEPLRQLTWSSTNETRDELTGGIPCEYEEMNYGGQALEDELQRLKIPYLMRWAAGNAYEAGASAYDGEKQAAFHSWTNLDLRLEDTSFSLGCCVFQDVVEMDLHGMLHPETERIASETAEILRGAIHAIRTRGGLPGFAANEMTPDVSIPNYPTLAECRAREQELTYALRKAERLFDAIANDDGTASIQDLAAQEAMEIRSVISNLKKLDYGS